MEAAVMYDMEVGNAKMYTIKVNEKKNTLIMMHLNEYNSSYSSGDFH